MGALASSSCSRLHLQMLSIRLLDNHELCIRLRAQRRFMRVEPARSGRFSPEIHRREMAVRGYQKGLLLELPSSPWGKPPPRAVLCKWGGREGGGEGGIRTLGTLLRYGALAKRCFRPLSHLTNGSREYDEELSIANTDIRRVFAIQSQLLIVDCRLNTFVMISEDEARAKILGSIRPLPGRRVALSAALDCFATRDLVARIALPNFDNSAMDGYAVVASDCRKGNRLRVIGEQPAGEDRQLRVASGEAVRIFTGAPMPAGADAVIMQEDVTRHGDEIVANDDVDPGQFVRRRGCDLTEGQKILSKGERIRATTLALLASQGFVDLEVGGEVRASIISTGDELVDPAGQTLRAGQIYETNSILGYKRFCRRCGAVAGSVQHCADQTTLWTKSNPRCAMQETERWSSSRAEFPLANTTLFNRACEILAPGSTSGAWRSNRGNHFFSAALGKCAVFGLPGNAVSAFVTFLRFVRPAILQMMGAAESELASPKIPARVGCRSYERRRSNALFSRPTGRRKIQAGRPPGIARAFRFEPVERNPALDAGRETFERGAMVER